LIVFDKHLLQLGYSFLNFKANGALLYVPDEMAHTLLDEVVCTHIVEEKVFRQFTELGVDHRNEITEKGFIAFNGNGLITPTY